MGNVQQRSAPAVRGARIAAAARENREVWLISLASALFTGAFLGLGQLLSSLYALRLGFGPEYVGSIFAAGAISFAAASFPGGALGARFGVRRMMIVGAIQNIVGMALIPFAEVVPEGLRSVWMPASQAIASSGWAVFSVNMIPAVVAVTTPDKRRGAYAMREATAGVGMFLGTLVGGFLPAAFAGLLGVTTAQPAPYRYGLWGAVVLGLIGLVPLSLIGAVPAVKRTQAERMSPPRILPLALLAACAFANNGAIASCKAFSSAYMDLDFALPTSVIGTITSVGMFLGILSALVSPRLARRGGSGHTMRIASIALALNLLQMAVFSHQNAAGLGLVGMFAIWTLWRPAFQSLQMEMAQPGWRALVSGTCSTAMSLGFGLVSYGGGYVVTAFGYRRLFLIGALSSLASALLMTVLLRVMTTVREADLSSVLGEAEAPASLVVPS